MDDVDRRDLDRVVGDDGPLDPRPASGPIEASKPAAPSRRVVAVATIVLLVSIVAVIVDSRRTRSGTLTLRRNGHDVRIVLEQGGRVVRPPTADRFVTLPPGVYDLSIDAAPAGLRIVPDRVTIRPAGEADASIESLTPRDP